MSEGNIAVENNNSVSNDVKDFVVIPDNFFIFKSFEISEKTSSRKLLEVVMNQIVESSPFPIEQLLWGYVQQNYQKNTWVWYAGLKEKIQSF